MVEGGARRKGRGLEAAGRGPVGAHPGLPVRAPAFLPSTPRSPKSQIPALGRGARKRASPPVPSGLEETPLPVREPPWGERDGAGKEAPLALAKGGQRLPLGCLRKHPGVQETPLPCQAVVIGSYKPRVQIRLSRGGLRLL